MIKLENICFTRDNKKIQLQRNTFALRAGDHKANSDRT